MRKAMSWAVCAALLAASVGGAARAQVKAGSETGLGLTGADVPPLLATIKADPYKAPTAPACDTVPAEILAINDLIGADLDTPPEPEDNKKSLIAKSGDVARGLVPYGGVVRFVTGANKKDKELREAVLAGYARRGFLRGVEVNMKCHPDPPPPTPAPPAPPARSKGKAKAH
ncbi:hypothetical protein [Phenylobacterium sp.]|uniref:hypothetical protein n=1 Tax=Phenylobacterium sp. TaxID=1871053 RepID=UPI002CD35A6F|nr:hypothetical protein [Phenylobacterium sp.]HLZ74498.1 hypothetical protein [Phenylobacterium sp.]